MKACIFLALLGIQSFIAHTQTSSYHWEINGVAVPGATSVTFVADPPHRDTVVIHSASPGPQLIYTAKMLHAYKVSHLTGSLLEVCGATIAAINLEEENRTLLPKSHYTPFYVIGGGLALTGYVINEFIAPGFISRAGMSLRDNAVCVDLP